MPKRRRRSCWAAALVLVLGGCDAGRTAAPDPSDYEVPHVRWDCGQWQGEEPVQEYGFYDVWFYGPSEDGPTDENRRAIRAVGGRIVHEFHAPIIRAILSTTSMWDLDHTVWGVPDAADFRVDMAMRFRNAITDSDRAYLEGLGATLVFESSYFNSIVALVPDDQLPVLRTWDRLLYVHLDAWVCPKYAL